MTERTLAILALAMGLAIRIAALPLPGAGDVGEWKIWTHASVVDGVTTLYGRGPAEDHIVRFNQSESTVNYPPLALYELDATGRLYGFATSNRFADSAAFTVTLKTLPVVFEAGLILLLGIALRAVHGGAVAWWAVAAYWLNPAAIADASIGGYLDPLYVLPAVAALVAAASGRSTLAGGLVAASALTKPLGVLVGPAVLIVVWHAGEPRAALRRLRNAVVGGSVVCALLVAPFVAAGAWRNMLHQLPMTLTADDSVSMSGYNAWWLAGHVVSAAYASMRGVSLGSALRAPADYVLFDRAAAHGLDRSLIIALGTAMVTAAIAWSAWIGRRARDLALASALGAFAVIAYATLGTQIHENHAFGAVPLLVVAAAGRRRFAPILIAVSALVTLNLVFYGLSDDGRFVVSRAWTGIDATLVVAALDCVVLVWFGWVLRRECRSA
ncbi:MAG: hypothetical protein ACHQO8_11415 [Vicinamibacterales bacterium]